MEQKIANILIVEDYDLIKEIDSNSIIITATQNLKRNGLFNGAKAIMSFSDLLKVAQKNVDYKECINNSELRYIIYKTIEEIFEDEKKTAYQNCVNSLEGLYSKLILNNITDNEINKIDFKNKYSFVEKDIFDIYKKVYLKLQDHKQKLSKIRLIEESCKIAENYNQAIFVGFVFFNELQEAFIKNLNINKLQFINKKDNFIQNDLIFPLLNSLDYKVNVSKIENSEKTVFAEIENKLFTNEMVEQDLNNLIDFYEPFSNREEEFLFVAREISNNIKSRAIKPEQIENVIEEYAVVLTKNKNELSKILNDALGQYGVFIPNQVENSNLQSIYYSKQDFLNEKVSIGHKQLSYVEKLKLFDTFKRIKVSGTMTQSAELPIGKFIIEVNKVVANDLTIENFKTLINSQWYSNKVADTAAIQDFYKIQVYFENLVSMQEWKEKIDQLIDLKKKIEKEKEFNNHPLFVVSENSLKYIKDYLEFLDALVCSLKMNGNIRKQVELLITNFNLKDIKLPTDEEQETLDLFIQTLNNIESNESIEIDYKYFAEHIKELIDQYSVIQQKDISSLKLPVVNMENYTKYDYVYFPMFEEDKYPRVLKTEFPYTNNIIKILKGLGIEVQKNQDMAYHLKMSRHIFKNVFGFVKKKLTFTYTCKEKGNDLDISIYAKDISRVIGKQIKFTENKKAKENIEIDNRELVFKDIDIKEINLNQLLLRYLCPKNFYYTVELGDKICYQDKFLLNFFAKALITNKFFINLAQTNKEYLLFSREFEEEVEKIFQYTYNQIMQYFVFFSANENKDIKITSKKYINDFIEMHFKSGKFAAKQCRFILGKGKIIQDAFIVKTRPTLIMINTIKKQQTEFDISKSLDYLVSSSGGKKYKLEHYDEIIEQLITGTKIDDKIELVNFASFKVNTQLNNAKFYQDGVIRTKHMINKTPLEFSNMGDKISNYCRFCKMKNTCKGVLIDD